MFSKLLVNFLKEDFCWLWQMCSISTLTIRENRNIKFNKEKCKILNRGWNAPVQTRNWLREQLSCWSGPGDNRGWQFDYVSCVVSLQIRQIMCWATLVSHPALWGKFLASCTWYYWWIPTCVQIQTSKFKKDMKETERVQQRSAKMVMGTEYGSGEAVLAGLW